MLDVQATVLPATFVHARQCRRHLFEYTLVYRFAVLFTATGGVPFFDFVETVQRSRHQQCFPLVLRITTRLAEHHLRYPYIQRAQAFESIPFAQHRRASKRMQQTAVDMPGLTFAVEQTPGGTHHTLHATFTATPTIRLFDPLALLAPEILKSLFGSYMTACYALNCHPVTSCAIRIPATWRRTE